MDSEVLDWLVRCAELRNPEQFNPSRERYIAEISYKEGMKKVIEWLERVKKIKIPKYQLREWGIE
ncbi:hypothetical protein LCGC14_0922490 [marine sediment metagenome]|uniref:Uncharacterized protein n=1 Tax=marine sediment metagenome TaxID=412755 RepID=A0A0F9NV38_9ZZZZ